jgi:hypothetical protein
VPKTSIKKTAPAWLLWCVSAAVDKKCPKIIESWEIQKIVAYDNIPFASASKIFHGQKQNSDHCKPQQFSNVESVP